ncbi:MAG: TIGR01906 family membrane protein [Erysipelothrix sp.]|nr:TIGR01906 family membrane protein [Erysipelothrix sp.]
MRKSNRIIIGMLTILIFIISILGAVSTSIFELDFYTKTQEKYNVAENMQISQQEVTDATIVALLYTKGQASELTYILENNGASEDLYSEQDKVHMVDVKNLYLAMYYTFLALAITFFILIIILMFKRKQINVFSLTLIINKVSLYTLVLVGMIALFAFVNFDQFWVMFHKIFFRNDLWLMNPYKDALVNLFPEGLFMDLVFKIILRFIIIFASVNIGAFLYRAYSLKEVKQ